VLANDQATGHTLLGESWYV